MNRILVVDDNPSDRRLLVQIVASLGEEIEVREADSGRQAMEEIQTFPPDLILLDIYLNDFNGLDILRELKLVHKSTIPVLTVSSFLDTDNKNKSLECGADDFIDKPIVPEDVKARVLAQLKLRKLFDDEHWTIEKANDGIRRLCRDLEWKKQELARVDRLKSEFVATVSHEIRTPLAVIEQLSVLISQEILGPLTDPQRQVMEKLRQNTKRLERIVRNLLDMSRIENRKLHLQYSRTQIGHLLRETQDFFQAQARNKGIVLRYVIPARDAGVFIDGEKIIQVLSNLIENAVKFTEPRGRIQVELKIGASEVRIGVSDTGIGIPGSRLLLIFEKFQQISDGEKGKNKGIGLGLTICRDIVERHRGRIWAQSRRGEGSRFYFVLPRYYTTVRLTVDLGKRIRQFLKRYAAVCGISFLVINYDQFQRESDSRFNKILQDLQDLMSQAVSEFFQTGKGRRVRVFPDHENGRYMILAPGVVSGESAKLCEAVRERFEEYLWSVEDLQIFIALGVSIFTPTLDLNDYGSQPHRFRTKEVWLGPKVRRDKRIHYKSRIEVLRPKNVKQITETIDLSTGGVCFMSSVLIPLDTRINVRIKLTRKRRVMNAWARIVSLSKVDAAQEYPGHYIIGIEFTRLDALNKTLLKKELGMCYEQEEDPDC